MPYRLPPRPSKRTSYAALLALVAVLIAGTVVVGATSSDPAAARRSAPAASTRSGRLSWPWRHRTTTTTAPTATTASSTTATPVPGDPGTAGTGPVTTDTQGTGGVDSTTTTATAGTPTPTTAATTTSTTAKPTTTAAPTTTAPPAGCSSPGNPWANLEGCGWAGPANTGARTANCPSGLTANSGATNRVITVSADNTVISCQKITGSLSIQARNVTIRDSVISYDGGGANGSGVIKVQNGASVTVDHVEINGLNHTHSCIWHQGTAMTAQSVNCYGVNDGIFSWADTSYSQTTGDNFTIRDSYFHDLTTQAANGHMDGYQTEGAAHGLIAHNTYLLGTDANSAIAIWNGLKSSSDITVTGNLITGGGFAVYAEDYHPSEASPSGGFTVTGITFTDNTFSTKASACVGSYGVWFYRASWLYQGGPTDGWHRSGNRVLETGENIDAANPHTGGRLCS